MKTLMLLIASLIISIMATLSTVAYASVIMGPPDKSLFEPGVPLNTYYIGINGPDGGCETMQLFAPTYDEALKIVKSYRCDFCVLKDMSAYYTSTGADVIAQANRTCPIR